METKQLHCKSCQKILPEGYTHKYCEACMAQKAYNTKKAGGTVLAFAGMAAVAGVTLLKVFKQQD